MRNDERLFLRKCLFTALVLLTAVLAVIWVFDTMFNGALLSFFAMSAGSLLSRPSRNSLLGYGMMLLLLLAFVGIITAYRTFMTQHTLYMDAKAEAERAKQLAETEMQRKSDLITYLAHDLKTPLASVIAYLSLLDETPELTPAQRAKFTRISLEKAYRLEQLIGELFEIIRFNIQTLSLCEEQIPLRFMLEQLADEFYPILLPQGKSIVITCGEGIILCGDSDKLARVFNNILKNAAVYSHNDTAIAINVNQDEKETKIQFINHGDLIPAHKQETIFEKFYRLDASRSTQTGGAGLGLAIAKEIVEAHGGVITVQSDADATAFTVTIPIQLRKGPVLANKG